MHRSSRSLLVATVLGLGTLTACQKAQVDPNDQIKTLLVGRWQLTASTSGMTGHTSPADSSQRRELVFTAAGQLQPS